MTSRRWSPSSRGIKVSLCWARCPAPSWSALFWERSDLYSFYLPACLSVYVSVYLSICLSHFWCPWKTLHWSWCHFTLCPRQGLRPQLIAWFRLPTQPYQCSHVVSTISAMGLIWHQAISVGLQDLFKVYCICLGLFSLDMCPQSWTWLSDWTDSP